MKTLLGLVVAGAALFSPLAQAQERVLVLFLNKSAGFEHSCIKWENGQPSHVDKVLQELAARTGAEVTSTKDASTINAENLKNYDVVIMYTSGLLTTEGTDGHPAMGPNGVEELVAWVRNGGGLVGYHCASDSFHRTEENPESPFLEMLGGEFKSHGKQFTGKLIVVDPEHPTMANVPQNWEIHDEWYVLENLSKDKMHVLALLDPREQREEQPDHYNLPNYPIIWCSTEGAGRVYYNAMGHREDVWDHPIFQQSVIDAVNWARGAGPAQAEPNYQAVVPETQDDVSGTEVAQN
jgi:uncharacterized protein